VRRAQQFREIELSAIDQREAWRFGTGQLGLPQERLLAVVGAVGSVDGPGIFAGLRVAHKFDSGEAARERLGAVLVEERIGAEPNREGVLAKREVLGTAAFAHGRSNGAVGNGRAHLSATHANVLDIGGVLGVGRGPHLFGQ